jgi:hypothetical protein
MQSNSVVTTKVGDERRTTSVTRAFCGSARLKSRPREIPFDFAQGKLSFRRQECGTRNDVIKQVRRFKHRLTRGLLLPEFDYRPASAIRLAIVQVSSLIHGEVEIALRVDRHTA